VVSSGCAIGPTVDRRPLTSDVRVRSEDSRCENVMRKVAQDKVSLRAPLFSRVIIIPPKLHIHLHLHFAPTRKTKSGNLPKKECSFGNRDALYRKVLSHLLLRLEMALKLQNCTTKVYIPSYADSHKPLQYWHSDNDAESSQNGR